MAISFNNNQIRRKNPIKRNNKFFSAEDFSVEMDFATEYMEQDANQTIILYQVDYQKTMVNDIYNEADKNNIRFKTPVELTVIYNIEDAETKAYKESLSKGIYVKPGKLTFGILLKELEENNCDISRGDYIGVAIDEQTILYWTVTNDGKMASSSNKNTLYGTKPYYREITCAPVDINDINL